MKMSLLKKQKGFTLIEVIMVIAIIAVLVSILGPRGLTAYQNAQLDTAAAAQSSLKTAVGQYYVNNKKLFVTAGLNNTALEGLLITDGSADDSVINGISLGTVTPLINTYAVATPCVSVVAPIADGIYDIDGDGTADTCGKSIVEIEIGGLTDLEGFKLSTQIDKSATTGTPAAAGTADTVGRIKYAVETVAGHDGKAYMLVEKD